MRIGRIADVTRAEGPGARFCVWVQGCSRGCPGCFAEALRDPEGGSEMSAEALTARLEKVKTEVRGVTLLGGEPFEQAAELAVFAAAAKQMGLDVIAFTGGIYETLKEDADAARLLAATDLLIDGPYISSLPEHTRPLAGSTNQRFLYLTDAFSPAELAGYKNRFEVRVSPGGQVQINGMGNAEQIKSIQSFSGGSL